MSRIIIEKDGKIYKFISIVLILDKFDKNDYNNCHVFFKNPLRVYDADKRIIGAVNLEVFNNSVFGNFTIDYATPERFNIENKTISLFPQIEGSSIYWEEDGVKKFIYYELDSILLVTQRPEDERIESI